MVGKADCREGREMGVGVVGDGMKMGSDGVWDSAGGHLKFRIWDFKDIVSHV